MSPALREGLTWGTSAGSVVLLGRRHNHLGQRESWILQRYYHRRWGALWAPVPDGEAFDATAQYRLARGVDTKPLAEMLQPKGIASCQR